MGFNADDKKVYDLLNDKEYIIPLNQRKYIWDTNNWTELLDDILLVFDEKKNDHFIGSIQKNGIKRWPVFLENGG